MARGDDMAPIQSVDAAMKKSARRAGAGTARAGAGSGGTGHAPALRPGGRIRRPLRGDTPPPCRLCFLTAAPEEIERCRVTADPGGIEEELLSKIDEPDTIVAFALAEKA
jgi:hypothetical protein